MLANKLLTSIAGSNEDKLYVDDVFSTYLYTGNGSTQTITNGIDLAGKGGMVWIKQRNGTNNHSLWDSARGLTKYLVSSSTNAQATFNINLAFNGTGFAMNVNDALVNIGTGIPPYTSWTFRKAPKFFDVVTYTGNGVAGRTIPHSLGVAPGMVIVKQTNTTGSWMVYHRSLGGTKGMWMELTNAANDNSAWNNTDPTNTVFTVSSLSAVNANGGTFVAYLFAHDTSTDGIVQCGSFTTDGSGNVPNVNLGWEPQYILYKRSDSTGNWAVLDASRGFLASDYSPGLFANLSNAESATAGFVNPTATGFQVTGNRGTASSTYIYLAIRRPNKPPTLGTQVYNAIARTGTGAAATVTGVGFAPDLVIINNRNKSYSWYSIFVDKLRGAATYLNSIQTWGDSSPSGVSSLDNDGASYSASDFTNSSNAGVNGYINHFFKRAPGVFDVVCYTGDGISSRQINHNLQASPEVVIIKNRTSGSSFWNAGVFNANGTSIASMALNQTTASGGVTNYFVSGSSNFNSSSFNVRSDAGASATNISGNNYVAYLFTTKAGISKVGSYNGTGSFRNENCGFTTGARFVMIKRVDAAGDWFIWDSARGIVSENDPHLSLNTTAAEVTTDDSIDPVSTGFIARQNTATNICLSGATYIYLAIA